MKDKIFGVLQRVGRSFMLPIALLPVAGLLLGIGSSFTNETMLEAYHLTGIIHQGSFLYTLLDIMNKAGSVVFNNLALLFAMGVAIGMAKKEKEVAALSGAIAYLIMNTAIGALISARGGVEAMAANSTTEVLGITTLQMGVFGGIIVGLGVAALHNRFYKIQLPQVLSFFGGTRFVPIISSVVFLFVGILMFFIWPVIQLGISKLGALVLSSGYAGTWIYGIIERALIPFGLHHVFYMPFWQTGVGGEMVVDGTLIQGAQNIFFAQLASPNTTEFSVEATRFMAGKFPFMIFGLPGAALAMYKCARPEKRKIVGGLLISAALTSMITGITEPLEFTFLFVAPLMYAVHCVLAGLSYMLMHIFNVGVGMTFSGGLIDMTLFGILQGNAKTHWIWIVIVGVVYFALYYLVFSFMIKKFNYKTPGREADDEETKLYTRADVNAKNADKSAGKTTGGDVKDMTSALILNGLGGKSNISDLDCCATRLRVTVRDAGKVTDNMLKSSGASGVIHKGNGVQVIYGPQVSVIKSRLEDFIEKLDTDTAPIDDSMDINVSEKQAAEKQEKKSGEFEIKSPLRGRIIPLSEVDDAAFSSGVLGDGAAIEPEEGKLYAPADGIVDNLFDTKHAIGITTDDGAELLIHIGMDTVKLKGEYFTAHVENGKCVRKGDLLISFDKDAIEKAGYKTVTPIVVCNTEEYKSVELIGSGNTVPGNELLKIKR